MVRFINDLPFLVLMESKQTNIESLFPMTFYANYDYKDDLNRYFNRAFFKNSLDFSFNKRDSEIYSPTLVEKIKSEIFNPGCVGVEIHSSSFHPILSSFQISETENETQKILDLLSQRKFKLLGQYYGDKTYNYVSLKFEKTRNTYKIFDHGKLFESVIDKYAKDKTFFKP